MTTSDWVLATIAFLSPVAAVARGVRRARAAERSAEALELSAACGAESLRLATAQLESSVRAHQDGLQPYLWVDLRAREDGSGLMVFVLGNSGPTVATNVRVAFQPALSHVVPKDRVADANHIQDRLREGLSSIAPGRVFMWGLGATHDYFKDEGFDTAPADSLEVTITGDGPHGPIPRLSYPIALEDLKHQALRPVGLGLVEAPLRAVGARLEEIIKIMKRWGANDS